MTTRVISPSSFYMTLWVQHISIIGGLYSTIDPLCSRLRFWSLDVISNFRVLYPHDLERGEGFERKRNKFLHSLHVYYKLIENEPIDWKWAATWENQQCEIWPGLTQNRLYNHRRWLEAWNFGFRKKRDCTIQAVKTKALISFTVTAKLICVFVFAYAKIRFSHFVAHFINWLKIHKTIFR